MVAQSAAAQYGVVVWLRLSLPAHAHAGALKGPKHVALPSNFHHKCIAALQLVCTSPGPPGHMASA